jgi:hypothetical protein
MAGAGIVLSILGVGLLYIGKSISGPKSDIMALAEIPFYVAGTMTLAIGVSLIAIGTL